MNTKEVIVLKDRSKENILETIKEYDEWIKTIQVIPNWLYWVLGISSVSAIFYFKIVWKTWPAIMLIFLAIKSFITLAQREGHKEGYLYGYDAGFDNGINKTLGINKNDEEFIEQVRIDEELNKRNKNP